MNSLKTLSVPGSDVVVPGLALGTMYWGTDVDTTAAHDLLDRAVDSGATFLDTANNYAFWRNGGTGDESESIIGEWLAGHDRDAVTLATKIGARPRMPGGDLDDALGLSPDVSRAQLEDSLRRLRTDHVDLLYAHVDDTAVPMADVIGGLRELQEAGLVRAIAASNLTADRLQDAVAVGGYSALQNRFTYLRPAPGADLGPHVLLDDEVAAVAGGADVLLVGYSCLLGGAYTRADRPMPDGYPSDGTALDALRNVAARHGLDVGQTVLAWMGQRSQPVIPVVGVSRPEQLASAVAAVSTTLDADGLAALDGAR